MPCCENPYELKPGRISVWFACVDRSPLDIREFETLLSTEEAARAKRFRFLSDRNRYIAQHGVLRSLLASYLDCGPTQIYIRSSTNGKPYLAGPEQGVIYFNASRSDAFAAYVFSRIGPIGVDFEKVCEIPDMQEIVDRNFTSCEKRQILACSEDLRIAAFYKLWTRKEAVLKAQGEGLLRPLDCVDVANSHDVSRPWKVVVHEGSAAEDFWVMDIKGFEGFAAAVASAFPFDEISTQNIEPGSNEFRIASSVNPNVVFTS